MVTSPTKHINTLTLHRPPWVWLGVCCPAHSSIEEDRKHAGWDLSRVAVDSFGACMVVTMLLDFWRLAVGGVLPDTPKCLPWM